VPLLRRISTRRLILLCVALVALGAGGAALALAATSGGPEPAPKPLAKAVHDAIAAPEPQGVTARIEWTNDLLGGVDLRGVNPLLTGATGRLWAANDGRFRLELQSTGGDAQVVSDGKRWWVYDGTTNKLYRGRVVKHRGKKHREREHRVPTVARIQRVIDRVMRHATVEGPTPTNIAGQPAYTTRLSPKRNGGLLGAIELSWDASRGTPLRGALYARGGSDPVVELKATEISYGTIASDAFDVSPPTGADVENLGSHRGHGKRGRHRHRRPVTGVKRVQARVPFDISAPRTLAGRKRQEVVLAGHGKRGRAVLVTYGRGLNGIAVIQKRVTARNRSGEGPLGDVELPTVSIDGTTAELLATPLGAVVRFERGGVKYVVAGSVTRETIEAAARGL
jgi:outer membrane lipoprotein-sorting protein